MAVCLGCCAFASHLTAQIEVSAQMSKREYVANEAVAVTITITNRAGRELYLHGDARNSWLDFNLKDGKGALLTTFGGNPGFKAVKVPAGRSVSQTVNLSEHYRVSTVSRYGGFATVRIHGDKETIYTSNRIHFNVTTARTIYSQKVGLPAQRTTREYRVLKFNDGKKNQLYVEVEDERTGRILRTFPVGESLAFHKPQGTVDGQNNLNVLYLATPSVFVHAKVNPDGRLVTRDLFKRGATGEPRLVTFDNGEVKTAGGIPYNPEKEHAQRSKVRRLSERPANAYRR